MSGKWITGQELREQSGIRSFELADLIRQDKLQAYDPSDGLRIHHKGNVPTRGITDEEVYFLYNDLKRANPEQHKDVAYPPRSLYSDDEMGSKEYLAECKEIKEFNDDVKNNFIKILKTKTVPVPPGDDHSWDFSVMIDGSYGYIDSFVFDKNSAHDLINAIKQENNCNEVSNAAVSAGESNHNNEMSLPGKVTKKQLLTVADNLMGAGRLKEIDKRRVLAFKYREIPNLPWDRAYQQLPGISRMSKDKTTQEGNFYRWAREGEDLCRKHAAQ